MLRAQLNTGLCEQHAVREVSVLQIMCSMHRKKMALEHGECLEGTLCRAGPPGNTIPAMLWLLLAWGAIGMVVNVTWSGIKCSLGISKLIGLFIYLSIRNFQSD